MCKDEKFNELLKVINDWKGKDGALMPVMHAAQEIMGCIDEKTQEFICEHLGVMKSEVYGVATFYSRFTLEGRGKYVINCCLGTACYVRGAQEVFDEFAKQLGVEPGHTSKDGLFTLGAARCIGCCGLAPAIMVNDDVYGKMTPDKVPEVLEKYRQLG